MSLSEQPNVLLPDYPFAQLSPQAFYTKIEGNVDENQLAAWPNALSPQILEGLAKMGLKSPTPIQLKIVNVSVASEHIHAQLGDVMHDIGRSSALSIHVANSIVREINANRLPRPGPVVACAAPYAIIVTPSREQAQETQAFLAKLLERRGNISVSFVHGDLNDKVIPALGTELAIGKIVCATAGGLMIAVRQKKISAAQLKYIVLDDTDNLLKAPNYNRQLNEGLWKIIADAKQLGHGKELRYAICTTGHISDVFKKTVSNKMLNIAAFTPAKFERGKQSLVHNEYKFVRASDKEPLLDVLDKFIRQTWKSFLGQKGPSERDLIIFVAKKANLEPVAARVRQLLGQLGATRPEEKVGVFHGNLDSGTEKKLRGADGLHRFTNPDVNCYVLVSTYAAATFTYTNTPNVLCLELPSIGAQEHERARIQTWFRAASCSGTGGHKGHVWTALRDKSTESEIVPTMIKQMEAMQLDVPQELKDILYQISPTGAETSNTPGTSLLGVGSAGLQLPGSVSVRSVGLHDRPIAEMRRPRNTASVSSASRPTLVTDTTTTGEPKAIGGVEEAASLLGEFVIPASRTGDTPSASHATRGGHRAASSPFIAALRNAISEIGTRVDGRGLQASHTPNTSHATRGGNSAASSHTPSASHATREANRTASSPFVAELMNALSGADTRVDVRVRVRAIAKRTA